MAFWKSLARLWTSPDPQPPGRAMVVGATGGIGRAYAEELAAGGYDLVLVARGVPGLEQLASELRSRHPVPVEILGADLIREEGLRTIESRLAGDASLTLLVNACGLASWGRFADLDLDAELDVIRLNVLSGVRLTRAALSNMLAKGRGGIINVASLAGYAPLPYCATYGASKAFLLSFNEAIYEELRGSGVRIQVCCPGFVRTKMFARSGADVSKLPSFIWIRPETIARSSLAALRHNRAVCIPGFRFRLLSLLMKFSPRSGLRYRTARLFGKFDHYRLKHEPLPGEGGADPSSLEPPVSAG